MEGTIYKIKGNPASICKGLFLSLRTFTPAIISIDGENFHFTGQDLLMLTPNWPLARFPYIFKCRGYFQGYYVAAAIDTKTNQLYLSAPEDISNRIERELGL